MTFEAAYETHYRSVVASSWAICRNREVAEELTQEAFARAYRRWRELDAGGHAVPWLHRVVMNLTISHVRRRHRGGQLERRHAATPRATSDAHSHDDWLVQLLHRLPRRQREAVFLRYVVDLDVEATAAAMRCSTGSVKTHSKRGLDRLRGLVEPTRSPFAPPRGQTATSQAATSQGEDAAWTR